MGRDRQLAEAVASVCIYTYDREVGGYAADGDPFATEAADAGFYYYVGLGGGGSGRAGGGEVEGAGAHGDYGGGGSEWFLIWVARDGVEG